MQQIEGNLLQPLLQSHSMHLHAAVVLLAVTAGGTLAGIAGAFLSVPIAAGAVALRYLGRAAGRRQRPMSRLSSGDVGRSVGRAAR